jgi:hypothetical protein
MIKSDMKTPEQTNPTTYSDRIMSTLYSTKVTATGGRHGHIRSEDGLLDMKLARFGSPFRLVEQDRTKQCNSFIL